MNAELNPPKRVRIYADVIWESKVALNELAKRLKCNRNDALMIAIAGALKASEDMPLDSMKLDRIEAKLDEILRYL